MIILGAIFIFIIFLIIGLMDQTSGRVYRMRDRQAEEGHKLSWRERCNLASKVFDKDKSIH